MYLTYLLLFIVTYLSYVYITYQKQFFFSNHNLRNSFMHFCKVIINVSLFISIGNIIQWILLIFKNYVLFRVYLQEIDHRGRNRGKKRKTDILNTFIYVGKERKTDILNTFIYVGKLLKQLVGKSSKHKTLEYHQKFYGKQNLSSENIKVSKEPNI